ncbi:LLM class flavin-dependent oxidoreductase [Agromyces albus]|uniref:LLM class flavin-dependent oxidoreductase n=1 Tax=Agromyces albus TaxID=205332 RepID=A0A4Q2L1X2_9MICO|nr:LLM class flavin-dependent oxidoreductase [Agromyces albus]RXZ71439.1 LLM class flavin-dependent oxidoreductase [Agromyces albus]
MTDYGHDLIFGTFITPMHENAEQVVRAAQHAERAGLDLVTFQDHPYQRRFLETWTLLSYVAARTERVRLAGDVLNLPLRPPAVLAKSVASLDVLSGGRVELGLGAGGFWDAIEAYGGRRLSPGQAVTALGEAIDVIRAIWDVDAREATAIRGEYYRLVGAKRGPAPAHPIEIWLGAYKPRMLRLTGTKADGWLPSIGRMSTDEIRAGNETIDAAAITAGREPRNVRRLANIIGQFGPTSPRLLSGPPEQWVDQLAAMTLEHGFSGYVLAGDNTGDYDRIGREVIPAVRELVAAERDRSLAS